MSTPLSSGSPESRSARRTELQQEAERKIDALEQKQIALGADFYGLGGGTDGFDFHSRYALRSVWKNPLFSSTVNIASMMGAMHGLYFFFRKPVVSKPVHILEMIRRTGMGALYALPASFALCYVVQEKQREERLQQQRERNHDVRSQYFQSGGQPMAAPPDVGLPGGAPVGVPGGLPQPPADWKPGGP
eukprot:TRINITY_DN8844_c0_g1_i1.p1 TRINITY_DN8844_c0_g1~~TRINITY_DN8844_c0_g1_i1.p1  ORF type:complete len:218 (+),score=42.79 TRINITY_DN8844_c0_g1_i1:89-655(+)